MATSSLHSHLRLCRSFVVGQQTSKACENPPPASRHQSTRVCAVCGAEDELKFVVILHEDISVEDICSWSSRLELKLVVILHADVSCLKGHTVPTCKVPLTALHLLLLRLEFGIYPT